MYDWNINLEISESFDNKDDKRKIYKLNCDDKKIAKYKIIKINTIYLGCSYNARQISSVCSHNNFVTVDDGIKFC